MIDVRDLAKHYRVHRRPPGLASALRSLVRRRYDEVRAVDGVTFHIDSGERVGFLGPNGAGKTTTLKMLAGLLHPDAGDATVDGHVPAERRAAFLRTIMLVTGQKQQLLWDLPPAETFELNRAVYDVPRDRYRATLGRLDDLLGLGDLIQRPTRQLSLGERMKCELAAALIHEPRVLFLDEPTIGLDVSMQATIRAFIRDYNEATGATVLLTSHDMDDVAALCPRVIVIDRGTLSYDGDLAALVRRVRPDKRLVLHFEREVAPEALAGLGTVVSHDPAEAVLHVARERLRQTVSRALAELPLRDVSVENPPLEEVMGDLFAGRGRTDDDRDAP